MCPIPHLLFTPPQVEFLKLDFDTSTGISWNSVQDESSATACVSLQRALDNYQVYRCDLSGLTTYTSAPVGATGDETTIWVYFNPVSTTYFKDVTLRLVPLPASLGLFNYMDSTFKPPAYLNHTWQLDGLGMRRGTKCALVLLSTALTLSTLPGSPTVPETM